MLCMIVPMTVQLPVFGLYSGYTGFPETGKAEKTRKNPKSFQQRLDDFGRREMSDANVESV